jgi:hypothetical protein
MNRIIKFVIGIPLIGLFSLWLGYMLVGFLVVGLSSLGLPAFPGCVLSARLDDGSIIGKIPPCPSVFSYSMEMLFLIGLLLTIAIFFYLFRLIYLNKK